MAFAQNMQAISLIGTITIFMLPSRNRRRTQC